MKIGFPQSSQTGEKFAFKTAESAVFDSNGLPLSDKMIEIPLLNGKTIAGIGDGLMIGSSDAVHGGFLSILAEKYPSINVVNLGVRGSTVAPSEHVAVNLTHKCIMDRIDDIPDTSDYIIFQGGINDYYFTINGDIPFGEYESLLYKTPYKATYNAETKQYANLNTFYEYNTNSVYENALDTSTFCGAFEMSMIKLVVRFGYKKYGVLVPHNTQTSEAFEKYLDAQVAICAKYGVPCLDMRKVAGMPRIESVAGSTGSPFSINETHLTEDGYRYRYLPAIEHWLRSL